MDIADEEARHRVAVAVKRRRRELRLRQEDVSAAGGPSTAVMGQIENSAPKAFTAETIESLEDALRLAHGSIEAVAAGGELIELDAASNGAAADEVMTLTWDDWTLDLHKKPGVSREAAQRVMRQIMAAAIDAWNESGIEDDEPPVA